MSVNSFMRIGLATLVCIAASAAAAHDIWITTVPDNGQVKAVVNFGHPDDRSLPYLDKLVSLDVISADGAKSYRDVKFTEDQVDGKPVLETPPFTLPPDAEMIAASYDNGYFVKTSSGAYLNTSPRMAPGGSDSMWAPKYTKTLLRPGAYSMVLGQQIELVPTEDPFTLPAGRDLHVKVLFHGKPLAGEMVELGDGVTPVADHDIPRFKTDAEGVATIPISGSGEVLLTVDHRTPGLNPTLASTDFYNASLDFVRK